jgi:MFS family permease
MKRKQLAALFFSVLVPYTIGGLLMPLLPVYISRLGIEATVSGFYFAVSFLGLAAGSLSAGWLSNRFQKRKWTLFIGGLLGIPSIYMMGQVNHIVPLTLLTIFVWFLGGINVATVNILTGISAPKEERGRIFGIIGTGLSLGGIIGGVISGMLVNKWGFEALFTFTAIIELVQMTAALQLEDKRVEAQKRKETNVPVPVMNTALWLLFGAGILASVANMSTALSRPLLMESMQFSAIEISSASAVAGFLTLPLSTLLGWSSDRIGRKPILIIAYSVGLVGIILLGITSDLYLLWFSAALVTVIPLGMGVGTALVTDVSAPQTLSTALARYASTPFIGGAIGFAFSGMLISRFGIGLTISVASAIAFAGIMLLMPLGQQRRKAKILAYGEVE